MAESLPEPGPYTELPQPILVIAGSHRQFIDWCRRRGLSPHHQSVFAVTSNANIDRIRRFPAHGRLELVGTWEDLLETHPELAAACSVLPEAAGTEQLAAFLDTPRTPSQSA